MKYLLFSTLLAQTLLLTVTGNAVTKKEFSRVGDHMQLAIPASCIALTALAGDSNSFIEAISCIGTTAVLTHSLKYIVREKRPHQELKIHSLLATPLVPFLVHGYYTQKLAPHLESPP